MMTMPTPHYLLFSEAKLTSQPQNKTAGRWHFVVEAVDGSARFEAADAEAGMDHDRLELLAVVRGLESLDQPARVTLVTASRYVSRGFRFGLDQWRESDWQWEKFGETVPVKNHDLWQRVDQAMRYHMVNCRIWRFDASHLGEVHDADQAPAVPAPRHARKLRRDGSRRAVGRHSTPKSLARLATWPWTLIGGLFSGKTTDMQVA